MQRTIRPNNLILLLIILLLTVFSTAFAAKPSIQSVTYREFDTMIFRARNSVAFVCIYTSTCPACNREMPLVNYLGKVYGPKGLMMFIVSVDDTSDQLAYYLNGQELFFEPLWLSQCKEGAMADIMDDYGGNYLNKIPYTAVIDRSGKVVKDWTGVTSYNTHAYWIEKTLGLRK